MVLEIKVNVILGRRWPLRLLKYIPNDIFARLARIETNREPRFPSLQLSVSKLLSV